MYIHTIIEIYSEPVKADRMAMNANQAYAVPQECEFEAHMISSTHAGPGPVYECIEL